jgi:hypothetical protein
MITLPRRPVSLRKKIRLCKFEKCEILLAVDLCMVRLDCVVRIRLTVWSIILQMLDIEDPVVANCLIDQRRIEYVLLADKVHSATDLMQSGQSGSFNELFTIRGDQLFSQPCYRNYASNGGTARYLTTNLEQLIRSSEAEKRQYIEAQKSKREEIVQAELEMRRNVQVRGRMLSLYEIFIHRCRVRVTFWWLNYKLCT